MDFNLQFGMRKIPVKLVWDPKCISVPQLWEKGGFVIFQAYRLKVSFLAQS